MDNFWDLKGFIAVFDRILTVVGCELAFVHEKVAIITRLFGKQQDRTKALFR
jgi:hypothetical protein